VRLSKPSTVDRAQKMKILTALAKPFNRLLLWFRILTRVRGIALKTQLGLFLSAFIDTLFHTLGAQFATLPRAYVSGIIYSKRYSAYFYIRAFADDLYSVMPGREGDVNKLILNCLKKGDIFIDVGANIGYYSVIAGKIVGESGRVISVEPVPSTNKILEFNIRLNQLRNVKIIQKAAWSKNESITLYIPKGFYGLSSINKSEEITDMLVVEGAPLDSILSFPKADLLKIDAEGSEYSILIGAQKTLRNTHYVVLEASNEKREIIQWLKEAGFKMQALKFTSYILAWQRNAQSFQHNDIEFQKCSNFMKNK